MPQNTPATPPGIQPVLEVPLLYGEPCLHSTTRGPEMREFQGHFKEAMRTSVPLLDHITRYIVRSKGKQMRPLLVYLSA